MMVLDGEGKVRKEEVKKEELLKPYKLCVE